MSKERHKQSDNVLAELQLSTYNVTRDGRATRKMLLATTMFPFQTLLKWAWKKNAEEPEGAYKEQYTSPE